MRYLFLGCVISEVLPELAQAHHTPVAILLTTEDVIHVEDIIAFLVVVSVILRPFTWLGKHPTWVARGFVFERRIADVVCGG